MKPGPEEQIAQWGVPSRGVVSTLPAHEIPSDALFQARNILVRDAVTRTRPGLKSLVNFTTPMEGVPTGAFNYRDITGRAYVLIGTTTAIYTWDGVVLRKRTGAVAANGNAPAFSGTLTGDVDHPSRFTSIEIGGTVYVLHTNGVDPLLQWDGTSPTFVPVTGDPVGPESDPGPPKPAPRFTDIATVGDHIVGLLPPYDVRWNNLLTLSQWPELNFKAVSETPDAALALRALGTLGAVLWKTDTISVFFFEGQSEASAFRFEFRGFYDGPGGVGAIVDVSGTQIYMTPTGRVGAFNGSSHIWIADAVWSDVRAVIDPSKAQRIVGLYDPFFHEVWFFYPRLEDTDGLPRGILLLALPRPDVGRTDEGCFPGALASLWGHAVTAGTGYRLSDRSPRVIAFSDDGLGYKLGGDESGCVAPGDLPPGEGSDAGFPFDWAFRTGLQGQKGIYVLQGIEPFMERDVNYGAIRVEPVVSYALPVNGGVLGPPHTIDLERRWVRPMTAVDVRGQFHGVRYSYDPTDGPVAKLRYFGSRVYGNRVE